MAQSQMKRQLVILYILFVLSVLIFLTWIVGMFAPFWCDVYGINLFTCFLNRKGFTDIQSGAFISQDQSQEMDMPSEQAEGSVTNTPEPPPTLDVYEDLEQAAADDPQLTEFLGTLKTAIETRDYETIETMISDPFNASVFGTEFNPLNKEEAMERISDDLDSLGGVIVDTTNEGRRVAHELYATPRESTFALVVYGWPHDSYSIMGLRRSDEGGYVWTDLIQLPPPE